MNELTCVRCGEQQFIRNQCGNCGAIIPGKTIEKISISSPFSEFTLVDNVLIVTRKWAHRMVSFFVFSLVVNFMIFYSGTAAHALSNPLDAFPSFLLTIAALCAAVFFCICCFTSTIVTVTEHGLTIEAHPLQVKRNREFPRNDIAQIFVSLKQYKLRGGRVLNMPVLQLMTTQGKNYPIFTGRDERDFAVFEALRENMLQVLDIDLVNYAIDNHPLANEQNS